MKLHIVVLSISIAAAVIAWRAAHAQQNIEPAAQGREEQTTAGGLTISSIAFGHQTREDDWPAIATSPDGSLWCAWLSFNGEHDDIALRHFANGKWSNIHWVPNTSGDSWMPQVAVEASNRVWVIWTGQRDGNWDLYARRFDATAQEWSELERLTSDPLPDINPRLASNIKGKPVAWVEVLKDGKVVYATQPKARDMEFQFTDKGDIAQRHYYYVQLQQEDRMTAWLSPFFVNYR